MVNDKLFFMKMIINSSYGSIITNDELERNTVKVLDDFYKIKRKVNVIKNRKKKIKNIYQL
jgi:predicted transcriptional regulator